MANAYRVSTISALIVCLVIAQGNATLFASEASPATSTAQPASTIELFADQTSAPAHSLLAISDSATVVPRAPFTFVPSASDAFSQRDGYRGGRGREQRRHDSATAALVLGAVASVAGTAILLYANRPECSTNPYRADGCGYGTKVVGGAALGLGVMGFTIAAITW
jgi:hypothetical protein